MHHLVVYAHPNPRSFSHALLEAALSAIALRGDVAVVRDLYATGFDPILKASDLEALRAGTVAPDVAAEQDLVRRAEVLTFIHPVWWTGLPAMLKGWMDRVLTYGFAYAEGPTGPVGLLRPRRVVVLSTQGHPDEVYERSGMFAAMKKTQDDGIYRFCGLRVAAHRFFAAVPRVPEATLRAYLDEVRKVYALL